MSAGTENDHGPAQPGQHGSRPSWLRSRAAIFAGVAAVGMLAGAGVAVAATGSPGRSRAAGASTAAAPSPSPSAPAYRRQTGRFRFGHAFPPGIGPGLIGPGLIGPGIGALFGAVHGQFVVAKPGGGYQTVDFQRGKVTAVSGTSITLESSDGYTHSYVVTRSTLVNAQAGGISSVKTGNQASVEATVSGGTATATAIQDLSLLKLHFGRFFAPVPPGGPAKTAVP